MGLFKKDKEAEAEVAAGNPPPYDDIDDVPLYEAPQFSGASDGSTQLSAATIKFPPVLVVNFSWKHMGTTWLGRTEEDRSLFTVSAPRLFKKQDTTLHDGPTDKDPVIGSAMTLKGSKYRDSLITLPPRQGGSRKRPLEFVMKGDYDMRHPFSLPVGNYGHIEHFEWRNSRAKEVKSVGQSSLSGTKLVRLTGDQTGIGGERAQRDAGFTSDGKEIVAIGAHTNKWKSGPKFAFVGTGLTGTLGEDWEIAAVMTFLRLHELEKQQQAAAAAAASA